MNARRSVLLKVHGVYRRVWGPRPRVKSSPRPLTSMRWPYRLPSRRQSPLESYRKPLREAVLWKNPQKRKFCTFAQLMANRCGFNFARNFRPHRVHCICLLLQTVRAVWTMSVFVLVGTRVSFAKTAEPIDLPFGGQTRVGTRSHVLHGSAH